jgi:hypothetical protein
MGDETLKRERIDIAHMTVELIDHPEDGPTFNLIAGKALNAAQRRPLFSGHIEKGMSEQLRELAFYVRDLEAKLDV